MDNCFKYTFRSAHQECAPQNQEDLSSQALNSPVQSLTLSIKDPFKLPQSTEDWKVADEHLSSTVVPCVLEASVTERHHLAHIPKGTIASVAVLQLDQDEGKSLDDKN